MIPPITRALVLALWSVWLLLAVHAAETHAPASSASPPVSGPAQQSATLVQCTTASLKAFVVFSVGEAGLWRPDCSARWPAGKDQPLVLTFRYSREIPARAFREAAENFLVKNGVTLSSALQVFNDRYRDVKDGDVYRLAYQPAQGLTLSLNGEVLARLDSDTGWQYFAIWLGEQPFNKTLKARLLGRE